MTFFDSLLFHAVHQLLTYSIPDDLSFRAPLRREESQERPLSEANTRMTPPLLENQKGPVLGPFPLSQRRPTCTCFAREACPTVLPSGVQAGEAGEAGEREGPGGRASRASL